MTKRRLLLFVASALAALIQARHGMAQMDPMRLAHVSMANQVGATEYCLDKGWGDQAAADAQKMVAASLPAIPDQIGLREAEAAGRKGELMNNGTTLTMSSMAQKGSTTEKDLCTRMASAAKTAAARQSSPSAKPAVQGEAAMPTLTPSVTVPKMPETVPAMLESPTTVTTPVRDRASSNH